MHCRHIVPISASIFIQLSSQSVFLSKFSLCEKEIQLKLILIPYFLLLTWSYLHRYHFQIKSHSQILGLGHQHTILRGAQLHNSPYTGTTMTHWKCCTRQSLDLSGQSMKCHLCITSIFVNLKRLVRRFYFSGILTWKDSAADSVWKSHASYDGLSYWYLQWYSLKIGIFGGLVCSHRESESGYMNGEHTLTWRKNIKALDLQIYDPKGHFQIVVFSAMLASVLMK